MRNTHEIRIRAGTITISARTGDRAAGGIAPSWRSPWTEEGLGEGRGVGRVVASVYRPRARPRHGDILSRVCRNVMDTPNDLRQRGVIEFDAMTCKARVRSTTTL